MLCGRTSGAAILSGRSDETITLLRPILLALDRVRDTLLRPILLALDSVVNLARPTHCHQLTYHHHHVSTFHYYQGETSAILWCGAAGD